MDEVLPSEKARQEVQKLFGYCIGVPGHPYQCAHLFVGEGNNGKSTLLAVLIALLGKENVSAETLTSLTENRFAGANLWGKLANVFADLPTNPLRYTSVFKALTGGDKVRAEAKFGKTFYFVNGAKLIFSANELPEVNDRTRAFWRRWQLVRFDQDFTGREDRTLLGKLLAELPGILNWALAGISVLDRDAGFLTELGADDLKSEWRRRSDTLAWFVSDQVVVDPTERMPKEEFYEAYAEFCAANQASPKSPEHVGKELPRHV
ncbi:DNA primase, partial [mine drainage metagenome]